MRTRNNTAIGLIVGLIMVIALIAILTRDGTARLQGTAFSEATTEVTAAPASNSSTPILRTPTNPPITPTFTAFASQQEAAPAQGSAPSAMVEGTCTSHARYVTMPGVLPVTVEWSVEATGDVTGYQWTFHDGSTSTAQAASYTYTAEGVFPVYLVCTGPFGTLNVTSSITITRESTGGYEIITVTPAPTNTARATNTPRPTNTPGSSPTPTITRTPSPTRTLRPTNTPGSSPTPTITRTPGPTRTSRPTNTPGPSPTPVPSRTPTPVAVCEIGVLPDPNTPGGFQFTALGSNSTTVNWNIDGTLAAGSSVFAQFTELGVMRINVECVGTGGTIRRTIFLRINVTTSIITGSDSIILGTLTPSPTPMGTDRPPNGTPMPDETIVLESTPIVVEQPFRAGNWQPIEVMGMNNGASCISWIAYHTNRTGALNVFRLGELPAGESGDVNLTRGDAPGMVSMSPSISPDRQWITFTTNRDGDMEIYVSAVAGDDIRRLSFAQGSDTNPVWSPDGRYIAFESDRDGDRELYLFDVTSGESTRLTDIPGIDVNVSWSPGSDWLAFQTNRDGRWQIYELTVSTQTVQRISDGTADDYDPVYSHDGTRIAFRSSRDGASALYIMNSNGSNITPISDPGGYAMSHTWSADDALIAYQSNLTGLDQIYVYEVATEQTRRITGDESTVNTVRSYAPTWDCDGNSVIIFTADIDGDSDVYSTVTYPIGAAPINVAEEARNMTNDPSEDAYPHGLVASDDHLGRENNLAVLQP